MAKKIVAVTDILHDKVLTKSGEVVDHTKFTEEQLKRFYDRGIIKIVDEAELKPATSLKDVLDQGTQEPKEITQAPVTTSPVTNKPAATTTTTAPKTTTTK